MEKSYEPMDKEMVKEAISRHMYEERKIYYNGQREVQGSRADILHQSKTECNHNVHAKLLKFLMPLCLLFK